MCPDFPTPPGGGATAAQVWAYGTRGLTGDAANAIRDAILSDATKIPGANVDAQLSLVKAKTDNLPTDPADQSLLVAEIATRAAAADYTAARAAKMDKIQDFIEEATGSLLMTGVEQTIKEILTTINKLHCFVDLTPMVAADTVVVRQYMKIASAGAFVQYAEETYNDAQTLPLLYIVTKPANYGIRVTIAQTAGTMRTFDWETFQEKAAA